MTNRLPMTRGRVLALAIGLPVALIFIGGTAFDAVAYAGQGSYPVHLDLPVTGSTAGISVGSGNMTVGPGAAGRLHLAGTAHYSLVRSSVTWYRTPSGVTAVSRCQLPAGVCYVNLTVTIPTDARALLSDGSGNMTLRGLTGHVSAEGGSGDIGAYSLPGTADLADGSGNIQGTDLSGPRVTLSSGSGDISVAGLASAHVMASDGSGNVTLTFTRVPSHVHVRDDSGDVTLILPPGKTLYRVTANTSSGSRVVSVPTSSVSTHVITVSDGSGNITVKN